MFPIELMLQKSIRNDKNDWTLFGLLAFGTSKGVFLHISRVLFEMDFLVGSKWWKVWTSVSTYLWREVESRFLRTLRVLLFCLRLRKLDFAKPDILCKLWSASGHSWHICTVHNFLWEDSFSLHGFLHKVCRFGQSYLSVYSRSSYAQISDIYSIGLNGFYQLCDICWSL